MSLETCCFGCLTCMCFIFVYLHLFSTTQHVHKERHSGNALIIIIITIIISNDTGLYFCDQHVSVKYTNTIQHLKQMCTKLDEDNFYNQAVELNMKK